MIGFRYHLVSIAAVLFALAVGIVLGTTTLSGPILDGLNQNAASLTKSNQQLSERVSVLRSGAAFDDQFISRIAPLAAAGRLSGRPIALVAAPGVPASVRAGLLALIRDAGGTVTADIQLASAWFAPQQDPLLSTLAQRLAGHALPAGTGAVTAAEELAAVLATHPGAPAATGAALPEVISAFQQAGVLTTSATVMNPATVCLVLAPAHLAGGASAANDLVQLAVALHSRAVAALLVGPSGVARGGATLAGAGRTAGAPPVVSGDQSAAGQLQAVLALVHQLGG